MLVRHRARLAAHRNRIHRDPAGRVQLMKRGIAIAAAGALLLLLLVGTSSSRSPAVAVAPAAVAKAAPMRRALPAGVHVVQAAWGDAAGELGRKHEQETNP